MAKIRSTPRTQDEILTRAYQAFEKDRLLGTEGIDLLCALDREHLMMCEHIDVAKIIDDPEAGMDPTTPADAHAEAVEYMGFALEKAHGQRGISAYRSLCHYAAWLWLCLEDEDWEQFAGWEDYDNYGLEQLATARRLLGMEERA